MPHNRKFLILVLLLLLAVPVVAQDAKPIDFGAEVAGSLQTEDLSAEYSFTGEQGQFVVITLASSDFDAFLRLRDPEGTEIATDDDSANNLNSRIGPLEITENGTYTIVASSLNGNSVGDFTLTLATANVESIEYGQTIEGELTTDELSRAYHFTGSAGDAVDIQLVAEDFDAYLELAAVSNLGFALVTDDDSGGHRNAYIRSFILPADGTYQITARSFNTTSTGDYSLTLARTVIEDIEYGQTFEGELNPQQLNRLYRFTGSEGDTIVIHMDSEDFDSYVELADEADSRYPLTSNDNGGGDRNALIGPFTLPADGSYLIIARSFTANPEGAFTLEMSMPDVTELEMSDSLEAEIEAGGSLYFQFDGIAGSQISIAVDSGDEVDTTLALLSPLGYELITDDNGGGTVDSLISQFLLAESGVYSIVVNAASDAAGELNIILEENEIKSIDETSQLLVFNDTQQRDTVVFEAVEGESVRLTFVMVDGDLISPSITLNVDGMSVGYASFSNVTEASFVTSFTTSGRVVVNVENYSYLDDEITVSLERLETEAE